MRRAGTAIFWGLLWASGLAAAPLSFQRDIRPLFAEKCVVCHACYDAPCQLKLGSAEGLERGASKLRVYDTRADAQAPTRLFFDGHGPADWQRRGFFPVSAATRQAALISRMLALGRAAPLVPYARLPETLDIRVTRDNQCPAPDEFERYANKFPHAGMPFAVTGLEPEEYQRLEQWLQQGAPVEPDALQPGPGEQQQIRQWEDFLNGQSLRQQLVGRYLYEHLFLADLYFSNGDPAHFFQLVRSRTPSGQPVDVLATRRPNDDPGGRFYYRLRPIQEVIVRKTHITYVLNEQRLARLGQLFLDSNWTVATLPGYGTQRRANPFRTFSAIPPAVRYRFLLDDALYFVRTFIRGPVCRGQIATDVIRDNFWVLFQQPDQDLYLTNPVFRAVADPLLTLPGQSDRLTGLPVVWQASRDRRNRYEALRQAHYARRPLPDWPHLWTGNDQAFLSVFRSFDSASVSRGLVGEVPQTLWWMDYPLLERTYYQLVVNFDVFGNVSHQMLTRLYFDLIRNGAEVNFLRLLPPASRGAILEDWYQDSGLLKVWLDYLDLDERTPSALRLPPGPPVLAFARQLQLQYPAIAGADPLNRCQAGACFRPEAAPALQVAEQALSRLTNRPASRLPVVQQLPEASLLRVVLPDGQREIYSLMRNRAHSNVAFMLGESWRYQPEQDTLTVYPGLLTSYPNFMFDLPASEVPQFVRALEQAGADASAFEQGVVARWGIRRSHPRFWFYFSDLTRYQQEREPREAGVLDMNRYENL